MKEKKQELELSVLSEATQFTHKILSRAVVDQMTADALQAMENEDADMS
jgi:hypothetical protein